MHPSKVFNFNDTLRMLWCYSTQHSYYGGSILNYETNFVETLFFYYCASDVYDVFQGRYCRFFPVRLSCTSRCWRNDLTLRRWKMSVFCRQRPSSSRNTSKPKPACSECFKNRSCCVTKYQRIKCFSPFAIKCNHVIQVDAVIEAGAVYDSVTSSRSLICCVRRARATRNCWPSCSKTSATRPSPTSKCSTAFARS